MLKFKTLICANACNKLIHEHSRIWNSNTKTQKQTITIDFLFIAPVHSLSLLVVCFKFPVNWHCSQTVLCFESFGRVWRRRPFIWLYIFPVWCSFFFIFVFLFAVCFFFFYKHWQTFVAYELKFNFRMSKRLHECKRMKYKNKNRISALTSAETATSMTNIYLHFFFTAYRFTHRTLLTQHIRKHTLNAPHTIRLMQQTYTFQTIGRSLWMNFNLFYVCVCVYLTLAIKRDRAE